MLALEPDHLDRRIFSIVQADSLLSNLDLAQRALASAPTFLRRVRRATESGLIERKVTVLGFS